MRRQIAGFLSWAVLVGTAEATTVLRFEREELARRATRVFVGEVLEVEALRDETGRIVTRVLFEVAADGWWKGAGERRQELRFPGGVLAAEGQALIVPGMPQFERGEQALIFACEVARGAHTLAVPVGLKQGKLRVQMRPNGQRVLARELGGLELFDSQTKAVQRGSSKTEHYDYASWREAVRRVVEGR